jgi:diguanylate cyclase (GGDEF)-like protein/PAS domain S-box-containing protein
VDIPPEEIYNNLILYSHDAIILVDMVAEKIKNANRRACEIYGLSSADFIGIKFDKIFEEFQSSKKTLLEIIQKKGFHRLDTVYSMSDGTKKHLEVTASYMQSSQSQQAVLLWVVRDVSSRNLIINKLRHDTLTDNLTQLANRVLFSDRVTQAIMKKKRDNDYLYAIIFLDINDFKQINDSLGHPIGDQYLIEVGNRLKATVREVDTVARFGGDEFVILLDAIASQEEVLEVCLRIFQKSEEGIYIVGNVLHSTFSIGVVVGSQEYQHYDDVIRDADIAMYKAKEKSGNSYVIFDAKMREDVRSHLEFSNDFKEAVEDDDFVLHYQPIISLLDGSIHSLEGLVRWNKKNGDLVYPDAFIPYAEKTGMILKLGESVLNTALQHLEVLKSSSHNGTNISVNISAKQLDNIQFSKHVLSVIEQSKISTGSLTLEVTESAIIQDINSSSYTLDLFKNKGVQISLDDFGTGYSSFYYLSELPIHLIKIDKSFVERISKTNNLNLLRSMISMGHELGKEIVAEGIENKEQLMVLRSMGCDYGQGYFIHKPAPFDEILYLIDHRRFKI